MDEVLQINEVMFEVHIGDEITNRQQMKAPKDMLISTFLQTAEQIKNDPRPIKIMMIKPEVIWDVFEQKQKVLNNKIELSNNARVDWELSKKEE